MTQGGLGTPFSDIAYSPLPKDDLKKLATALEERLDAAAWAIQHIDSQFPLHDWQTRFHVPVEALGEVSTSSASFVGLSGGPSITVGCRPGMMIAVLMDAELKNGGGSTSVVAGELDSSGTHVGGMASASGTYVRTLSNTTTSGGVFLGPRIRRGCCRYSRPPQRRTRSR